MGLTSRCCRAVIGASFYPNATGAKDPPVTGSVVLSYKDFEYIPSLEMARFDRLQ